MRFQQNLIPNMHAFRITIGLVVFLAAIRVWDGSPSPFFFLCHYHDLGGGGNSFQRGEVAVSIAIQGDPDAYVPGKIYSVVVESSADFDGFMMVGLYTSPTSISSGMTSSLPMGLGPSTGNGNMCSVVHSQLMAGRPSRSLAFHWMAPPDGSGCVSFLVTASLGQELLIKDTPALQLCQQGVEDPRESLHGTSVLEEQGVILRTLFREEPLDPRIWERVRGGRVGPDCGRQALVFCGNGTQELVSRPLNISAATGLQFSIGSGNCTTSEASEGLVRIQYSLDGGTCHDWEDMDTVRVRPDHQTVVVRLPRESRRPAVCFRWLGSGCWSLVGVLVSSVSDLGKDLQEDFDPADPANFLYLRGGKIRRKCGSNGAALVFGQDSKVRGQQWVTTRDLDLQAPDADTVALYKEDFEQELLGWHLVGVETIPLKDTQVVSQCGATQGADDNAMDPYHSGVRFQTTAYLEGESVVCTPFLNTSGSASLHFRFRTGPFPCPGNSSANGTHSTSRSTAVFAENRDGKRTVLTEALEKLHKTGATLILPRESGLPESWRYCWTLSGSSWLDLNRLRLLPWLASPPREDVENQKRLLLQFKANLHCKTIPDQKSKVRVEFSVDWGGTWHPLHSLCLPPGCPPKDRSFLSSTLTGQDLPAGWHRWTFPLPYAASVPGVRFRFKSSGSFSWALDELFVGPCPSGCWGRGRCHTSGKCTCDPGFGGEHCQISQVPALKDFVEPFSVLPRGRHSPYLQSRGVSVGYTCGILSEGKSALLSGPGNRELLLGPADTLSARHLHFRIRSGGFGPTCPGPDRPNEGVHLAASCDGGITWEALWWSQDGGHHERDRHVSLTLPVRCGQGALRWWQPYHSGRDRDLWALDDLVLGSRATDALWMEPDEVHNDSSSVVCEGSKTTKGHCGWDGSVLLFQGFSSQLETKPLGVGPNFMLQFHAAVDCESTQDGQAILVEYSTSSYAQGGPQQPSELSDNSLWGEWTPLSVGEETGQFCPEGEETTRSTCREQVSVNSGSGWTRIALPLGPHLWSPHTRIRLRPLSKLSLTSSPEEMTWALRDLYLGPTCPGLCSGHGRCWRREEGPPSCRCDEGYSGPLCLPESALPSRLGPGRLSALPDLEREGFKVQGAELDLGGGRCAGGPRRAPLSPLHLPLRFFKAGPRSLITPELDTRSCHFLQFFLEGDVQNCAARNQMSEEKEEEEETRLRLRMECTVDGGASWTTIRELRGPGTNVQSLEHVPVPDGCRGSMVRFRLRQISEDSPSWLLDGLYLDSPGSPPTGNGSEGVLPWPLTAVSQGQPGKKGQPSCGTGWNETEVTVARPPDGGPALVLTRPLAFKEGFVFQFQIAVGCSPDVEAGPEEEVQLDYSTDSGSVFLAVPGCQVPCSAAGPGDKQRRSFRSGRWTRVQVTADELSAESSEPLLRWRHQPTRVSTSSGVPSCPPYALRDFYLGPPCPLNCKGHGRCSAAGCICDQGHYGESCEVGPSPLPSDLWDSFEDGEASKLWDLVRGGAPTGAQLPLACGSYSASGSPQALRFAAPAKTLAEARTVEMDTSAMTDVHFVIRVGSPADLPGCRRPSPEGHDDVWLQWSPDLGLTWQHLARLRALDLSAEPRPLTLALPDRSRDRGTVFRWVQFARPSQDQEVQEPSAEWSLDNVSFRDDASLADSFREDFSRGSLSWGIWYGIREGSVGLDRPCAVSNHDAGIPNHALHLQGGESTAETWDFRLSSGSFLQFESRLGSCTTNAGEVRLRLDWSTDRGRSWTPADKHGPPWTWAGLQGWHRITLDLQIPVAAGHTLIRFRWRIESIGARWTSAGHSGWALDNIRLLGVREACPWMCSGHGLCTDALCSCDAGFGGPRCVSTQPLPKMISESFESTDLSWTRRVLGAEAGLRCGVLVHGPALVFFKDLRLLETSDLDLRASSFLQFTLRTGCGSERSTRDRRDEVAERSANLLLQYSNNGGISWHTIKEIPLTPGPGTTTFQRFPLNWELDLHTNATRLRIWQDSPTAEAQPEWALDELVLGGPAMQDVLLQGTLSGTPDTRIWMAWPGGQGGSYHACRSEKSGSALWFRDVEGERSITTWDLDLPLGSFLHFQIAVGCEEEAPWELWPVSLEWSGNGGATWTLLIPLCAPDDPTGGPQCYRRETSLYYPQEGLLWRDVVLPLDRERLCGAVRFRWRQGFFTALDRPPSWALRNVTLGPCPPAPQTCQDPCPCQIGQDSFHKRPTTLQEEFRSLPLSPTRWIRWSGAELSSTGCGQVASGSALVFRLPGERTLVSAKINTSAASLLQFHLRLGCNPLTSHSQSSNTWEPVLLLFSVDGGATWVLLEEFRPQRTLDGATFLTLELPTEARTNATSFKWWQPSHESGSYALDWAIDRVQVGRGLYELPHLEEEEERVQGDEASPPSYQAAEIYLSATRGGTPDTFVCGEQQRLLHFRGSDVNQEESATSTDVPVQDGMFLQFQLALGCSKTAFCYNVVLEMSTDRGVTWRLARESCPPWSPWCQEAHTQGSLYASDIHAGLHRVTQPLDPLTSSLVRFRWRSTSSGPYPFSARNVSRTDPFPVNRYPNSQQWAIGGFAFGTLSACPGMCKGRGRCQGSRCSCDPGWSGESCSDASSPLPKILEDNFETGGRSLPSGQSVVRWRHVVGAVTSDLCGPMPTATALHFYGGCSRTLESVDLDLRSATSVHFWIRFGCLAPSHSRDRLPEQASPGSVRFRAVLLQGSEDGGLTWITLTEMGEERHTNAPARLVRVTLPDWLRRPGSRLRWWQPAHSGRAADDWALDAIRVGPTRLAAQTYYEYLPMDGAQETIRPPGSADLQLLQMSSDSPFRTVEKEDDHWLRQDNVRDHLCGDWTGLVGKATSSEEAILETFDVVVQPGSILQFEVWVGCNHSTPSKASGEESAKNAVTLEMSSDSGTTWSALVPLCHPQRRGCSGKATIPSRFYLASNGGWRREVFPLNTTEEGPRRRRFRWRQSLSQESPSWSVRGVYLGPSCPPDHCGGGNGRCTPKGCLCTDQDCRPASLTLPRSLRWPLKTGHEKGTLQVDLPLAIFDRALGVTWGNDALMEGEGLRLLETTDMDLREARFMRFLLVLGESLTSLGEERDEEAVYLQYSFNRGITWFDLTSYTPREVTRGQVRRLLPEYLDLPPMALREQIRFRWWQMAVDLPYVTDKAISWTLSNIHVGGDAINPASLYQNFSDARTSLGEHFWERKHAKVTRNYCGDNDTSLVWPVSDSDEEDGQLVSRQLIVATDFVIQFKLLVGCGHDGEIGRGKCLEREGVSLEYTTDFARAWRPVEEPCLPSSLAWQQGTGPRRRGPCSPYRLHGGTFYRAEDHDQWTRITLALPEPTHSRQTQFRWRAVGRTAWAMGYLYVGEACPAHCSGRGDCREGVCHCDAGAAGPDCHTLLTTEPFPVLEDSFEEGPVPGPLWERVRGGRIMSSLVMGVGCGPLLASGPGRRGRLHFSGCGIRESVTRQMDTSRLGKVSYALRIGSEEGSPDCHVLGLANGTFWPALQDKGVQLQFSADEGITWVSLASHAPRAFLQAQWVWQDLPVEARRPGVRLRWWQPWHQGQGHDQWALDAVKLHRSAHLESWQKYPKRFHD